MHLGEYIIPLVTGFVDGVTVETSFDADVTFIWMGFFFFF